MAGRSRDLIFTILGIDRGSQTLRKVAAEADRTGGKLDKFGATSQKALGATAAAALGAGAGIGGALAGTAVVVGAAGLALVANNTAVSDSFGDLWNNISRGSKEAAAPLADDLLAISDQLQGTFDAVQPRLRGLFEGSMPAVHAMVDGVDGLIRNTLPGLEAAVAASEEPAEALRDVLIDVGDGATDFFTNISKGSDSSARIIRVFGGIAKDALGFTGDLLARLSNEGAPAVERLGQVFTQLTGVITQLSSGALPVMVSAVGAGLNVISGLTAIAGGASGQLGPLIGTVLSAAAAFKAMDAVSFGKLSGSFGQLRSDMGSATTISGKMRVGLTGLLTGFGPVGLAAGGLGVMLGVLGQRQQEAAQKAAEHQARVQSLTDALVASGGAITENIAATQIKAAKDAQLYDIGERIGLSQRTITQAVLGNRDALTQANAAFDRFGIGAGETNHVFAKSLGIFDGFQGEHGLGGLARVSVEARTKLAELNGDMINGQQAAQEYADAQSQAADATDNHTTAMLRLQTILLGFVDKQLGYRQAIASEKAAHDAAVKAIQEHGGASNEATAANLNWEQSIMQSVAAAGEFAASQYTGTDATEKARRSTVAQNREILRLAQIAGNNAPPALRQMIGGMDRSTMAALGMKISVDKAGRAVVTLPNGKTIRLRAQDLASPGIHAVENALNRVKSKTVVLRVLKTGDIQSSGGGRIFERAEGGPITKGQPYLVGERGPELIFPDHNGMVFTAGETRRMMAGGAGGGVLGGGTTVINFSFPNYVGSRNDLMRELREAVRTLGRGSAERLLGGRR